MKVKRLKQNELQHHGIKGQKWGVRNGPPYPIEDKVLRKGTKLNTVARATDASDSWRLAPDLYRKVEGGKNWLYTYNNDHDQKIYKGPFAKYLVMEKGANYLNEHKYEVVRDLKMPTKKERVDEFLELYKNNKKTVTKDLAQIQKLLIYYKVGDNNEQKDYKSFNAKKFDPDDKKQAAIAYSMFNHLMEASNKYKSTILYKQQIEKKFDAMIDDNNQGVYNNAYDPIIVFKAEQMLKTIGTEPLSADDITKNYDAVEKEMERLGRNVKL